MAHSPDHDSPSSADSDETTGPLFLAACFGIALFGLVELPSGPPSATASHDADAPASRAPSGVSPASEASALGEGSSPRTDGARSPESVSELVAPSIPAVSSGPRPEVEPAAPVVVPDLMASPEEPAKKAPASNPAARPPVVAPAPASSAPMKPAPSTAPPGTSAASAPNPGAETPSPTPGATRSAPQGASAPASTNPAPTNPSPTKPAASPEGAPTPRPSPAKAPDASPSAAAPSAASSP